MELHATLIGLGGLFFMGLLADALGRRTKLPRVTLLLLCGLLVGKVGFDLLPAGLIGLYETISIVALTMVAFLLGGALSIPVLQAHGRAILIMSLSISVGSFVVVSSGLAIFGADLETALVLGAIATATAPAATIDVIRQVGIDTDFTRRIAGIVAIDDAWGLVIFSLAMVMVHPVAGTGSDNGLLAEAGTEILGSLLLGAVVGLPAAYLTGRLSEGEPLRIEALGLVFLTAGLALWLDLSFLIAGMMVGALIVNLARHHTRAFHEIEGLQWPFMVVFFILAGAGLELSALAQIGAMGLAYILLRLMARLVLGWLGARLSGAGGDAGLLTGLALMPQAGVAIGMALVASAALPDQASTIMAVTIGSTVVFELVGPLATAWAIRHSAQSSAEN